MNRETLRPAWAEIDLTNLSHNIRSIQDKVASGTKIIGIIKADAYGHGALKVAEVLRTHGVKSFGVATIGEGTALRAAGFDEEIVILGLVPDQYAGELVKNAFTAVTCSLGNAKALSSAGLETGRTIETFIALDTGMGRIGYLSENEEELDAAIQELQEIQRLPNLQIKGLFSHMSTADEADKSFSKKQEQKFEVFYQAALAKGVRLPMRTFANSACTMEMPSVHFDAVRPGIVLYGCYPSDQVDPAELDIKPVMTVKAEIVHLKEVPSGFSVSYGRKFITKRASRIATINLGYADGYPRAWSKTGQAIVNGCMVSVAGNICMDQCMLDVTDVPDVKVGDQVIVMGSDGTKRVLAEDIAKAVGTINYEILCGFGQRLPKIYK